MTPSTVFSLRRQFKVIELEEKLIMKYLKSDIIFNLNRFRHLVLYN